MKDVSEYIDAAPKDAQAKLKQMRTIIRAVAPDAKEGLKWGMPAYSHKRILVMFAAAKNHIGFYPTPSAIRAFSKDLWGFNTSKGAIQFPLDKPLPVSLIRKMTEFRIKEEKSKDVKWREK